MWPMDRRPLDRQERIERKLRGQKTLTAKVSLSFKTLGGVMKKVFKVFGVILVMSLLFAFGCKEAQAEGFEISTPLETGVTAFWFPEDNTLAGGISFTALRFKYVSPNLPTLSKIAIDLDGTVAKEINETQDTLYGIGAKASYDVDVIDQTGFVFKPSLGITALRDIHGIREAGDLLKDFKFAVYGTVVLYKF